LALILKTTRPLVRIYRIQRKYDRRMLVNAKCAPHYIKTVLENAATFAADPSAARRPQRVDVKVNRPHVTVRTSPTLEMNSARLPAKKVGPPRRRDDGIVVDAGPPLAHRSS
jgi:hypothetical protein